MTTDPPARPIPEDRIPDILARAAELDRERRETITPDALRVAALDAGISAAAVDAALAEYAGRQSPETPRSRGENRTWGARARAFLRRLAPVAGVGVVGLVAGLAGEAGDAVLLLTLPAVLAWGVWMIRDRRPRRAALGFVIRLAVVTIAIGIGWEAAALDEGMRARLIGLLFSLAIPLAALGSLVIKVRLPRWLRRGAARAHAG
jgi:hypothetical protein